MTAIIDVSDVDRPVIVITRDFDAPCELVWKAITDPKQVASVDANVQLSVNCHLVWSALNFAW